MTDVSFPILNLHFVLNKTAFNIYGLSVKWYAIMIATGMILGILYIVKNAKRFDLNADMLLDMVTWAIPIAIIGARLYYVVFEFDFYKENPQSIFAIWEGGLAIYGAVIFGAIFVFFWVRAKKLNLWNVFDISSIGLIIGQIIGRFGNFVNGEAFGSETNLPWRMVIYGQSVHPTFLYESLWNLAGFFMLHKVSKKRKFEGQIVLLYFIWYGIGRAMIEGLRTDSLYLWGTGIRISQALSIVLVIASVIIYFFKNKGEKLNGSTNY